MSQRQKIGRPFPRYPLYGAGTLILITLVLVAIFGEKKPPPVPGGGASVVAVRDLRFEDRKNGAVAVVDPTSQQVLELLPPGTNGFLRATLRGLARDRRAQNIGAEPAFRLRRWTDGRLSLEDPTTGRYIDLAAFGQTNVEAFARLLNSRRATP